MALKIKLSRMGKRKRPSYRIVVAESGKKRDSAYVDRIGFYDPMPHPYVLKIDRDKLSAWQKRGAQLSDGVFKLLKHNRQK